MKAIGHFSSAKTTNWTVCLLSASLMSVAASNWLRPAPVSAQATAPARRQMTGESRQALTALQDAFTNIADTVEPSVVTIEARIDAPEKGAPTSTRSMDDEGDGLPEPFRNLIPHGGRGDNAPRPATGSGVIVRESGSTYYVLTNNHVVDQRNKFSVHLSDGTKLPADLVGTDQRTDLAVLKFRTHHPLPAGSVAQLGDSDRVRVGQWAIAIGSPLGYESTLTVGVISAKGRELHDFSSRATNYVNLLQTDASINPGNSGGPLVNVDGEVVGINVAIASSGMSQGNIGIGFAIPVNTAKMVMEQLIGTGKVVRGYLGVRCSTANRTLPQELRDFLKSPQGGALVEDAEANTPAGRAGLRSGDVIVRFGEHPVRSFTDLESAVAATKPGTTVPLEVVREGKPFRTSITPVVRPSEAELAKTIPTSGPEPKSANAQPVRSKFGLSLRGSGPGVTVAGVAQDSPAAEAGIAAGDEVLSVGTTATPTVEAFQKAVNGAAPDEGLVLRIRDANGLRFVVLRP